MKNTDLHVKFSIFHKFSVFMDFSSISKIEFTCLNSIFEMLDCIT